MLQASQPTTINPITIADIRPIESDERVSHKRLAGALGLAADWKLRQLVDRNDTEFRRYGDISTTAVENTDPRGRGRPGKVYWLNEGQCILAAVRSDAPRAADVRYQVITAFMEYRRQRLGQTTTVREHERRTSTKRETAIKLAKAADRLEALAGKLDPQPAAVVPSVVMVAGRPVLVDVGNFRPKPGQRAVVIRYNGELEISTPKPVIKGNTGWDHAFIIKQEEDRVISDRPAYGLRTGQLPWVPGPYKGSMQAEDCTILGIVIESIMDGEVVPERIALPRKAGTERKTSNGRTPIYGPLIRKLIADGKTNTEIVKETGAHYNTVLRWRSKAA
ncbi:MAG: hypothetical protein WBB98_04460 [Xanthobacteraceae bacterium]